eukprot:SAG22_NODE_17328_length_307_cov_0.658654_1_plen_52_part_10
MLPRDHKETHEAEADSERKLDPRLAHLALVPLGVRTKEGVVECVGVLQPGEH